MQAYKAFLIVATLVTVAWGGYRHLVGQAPTSAPPAVPSLQTQPDRATVEQRVDIPQPKGHDRTEATLFMCSKS